MPPSRLPAMLADLPRHRAVGAKRDAKGHKTSWIGYKPHLDVADGGIPIGCLPASASPRDSQAAIPLATMTAAPFTAFAGAQNGISSSRSPPAATPPVESSAAPPPDPPPADSEPLQAGSPGGA